MLSHSRGHKDVKSGLPAVIGSAPLILPLTAAFITTSFVQDYCAHMWCLFTVGADVCWCFADACNMGAFNFLCLGLNNLPRLQLCSLVLCLYSNIIRLFLTIFSKIHKATVFDMIKEDTQDSSMI